LSNNRNSNRLEALKQNSWEPEILISGIAIFGLFQVPDLLDDLLVFIKINLYDLTTDVDNLIALLKVSINWVTLGLMLHLFTRAIWVGFIGLTYTFPKGIDLDRLALVDPFEKKLKEIPPYQVIIEKLENFASSVFSFSFLLFMSIIGAYIAFLVLLLFPILAYHYIAGGGFNAPMPLFMNLYVGGAVIILLISLFDFVSLGFLKRFKVIAPFYWPIYQVMSILTFARFYRPIYYGFISNYDKWKIIVFLSCFALLNIFWIGNIASATYVGDSFSRISLWNGHSGYTVFNGHFDDQNEEMYSLRAQIQSDIIKGNTIRLFLVALADEEKKIREYVNYDSIVNSQEWIDLDSLNLEVINQYYQVYLGDSLLTNLNWNFHYKMKTRQKGYLSYIDVTDLPKGLYELNIKPPGNKNWRFAAILFYRE